jgi:hypothetical protein
MNFKFKPHVIDSSLSGKHWGQTALADIDHCGRPEYLMGSMGGELFIYKYHTPEKWTRHILGSESPSDVGAVVIDVDGDGWVDFVSGGVWYKNSRSIDRPFERIVFDPDLDKVHDVFAADIDGDGRMEILTMSDQNNMRWYRIPANPAHPWKRFDIGQSVHAGMSAGDLNGDGCVDIVRTDVWFENVKGDGTEWRQHPIGPNTQPPPDFQEPWAFNATKSLVCDMNRDGRNDVVFADAEIPGGKIWWMENLDSGRAWKRHEVAGGEAVRRGAYHTLHVGDMDGDGDLDIVSCEMEWIRGGANPRYYIWENVDGKGEQWKEHVICDINLGGHEAVVGDITGNGLPDIIAKPWVAHPSNAVGGKNFVLFLENISQR